MKKTIMRVLSLALCLVLLAGLMPVQASAATVLGKPQNVVINKTYDYRQRELVTKYGSVSWQVVSPLPANGETLYQVTLLRDGKVVHSQNVGWPNPEPGQYISFDLSPYIERSGTYKMTVQAVSDSSEYQNSGKVSTKSWTYRKPGTKLNKPSNAGWNWPDAIWSGDGIFQIQMYYSPTKVTEKDSLATMNWFHTEWNIDGNVNRPPYGDFGPGYYRFRVRTQSANIVQDYHSDWISSDVYYFPMGKAEPKAVLSGSKECIEVSWDDVEYAFEYEVYRATAKNGDYKKVNTTTEKSFADQNVQPGKTYYYKVRTVSWGGFKTTSDPVGCSFPIGTPSVKVSHVANSGKVKLSWNKITGAKAYEIYQADAEDGEYTLLKTVENTGYTVSSPVGITYWYKVKAIIGTGSNVNSEFSEAVSGQRRLNRPVVTAKVAANTGKIGLTWKAVDGAVAYNIFRATDSNGEYEYLETVSSTDYTDHGHMPGQKFYYKVIALYTLDEQNTGANSAESQAVSGTCKLARPDVSITRSSKGKPEIHWDAVAGAMKYEVYRSTKKGSGFKRIKTVENTEYTDSAAAKGKTYYYKVKALTGTGSGTSSASVAVGIKSR